MTTRAFPLLIVTLTLLFASVSVYGGVREYHLEIAQLQVTVRDKVADGMTINGGVPGPTLYFERGELARIHVKNSMSVPTSIHWHGLLVPPGMDGVPKITQKPIAPGETFIYEFQIRQTGTYWYHSHSGLQEQRGLYGSIVITDGLYEALSEHVVLLSDWTAEPPDAVLKTLKRGSHWYGVEKGSAQSIFGAAKAGRLADYFSRELQRMPAMDISDIAYDYFLSNGAPEIRLETRPGKKVRLRIINGSATTYFHLNYAGGPMTIISADGQLVQPLEQDLFLIGVAETYDLLVEVPESGSYEFRATAHDGSGFTSTWLGEGPPRLAKNIPKPDLYLPMEHGDMGSIFALTPAGTMGMSDAAVEAGRFDQPGMAHMMHSEGDGSMEMMDHGQQGHETASAKQTISVQKDSSDEKMHHMNHSSDRDKPEQEKSAAESSIAHSQKHGKDPMEKQGGEAVVATPGDRHHKMQEPKNAMTMTESQSMSANHVGPARTFGKDFSLMGADIASRPERATEGGPERPLTPYSQLRSLKPSSLPADAPVREVRLTLDGDMERYTWFINNKPLSETDSILMREGEVVRFIMINRTMMHHPMHLHGHFFRVLNGQGANAPLKHTVDVAPMSTTVIEFYGNEVGDWFFHCHLLYHMKSGMARLVHYDNFKAAEGVMSIRDSLYDDPFYFYGTVELLTNMSEGELTLTNSRWELMAGWEIGWQDVDETDWEGLITAGYHFNRFTSIFAGVDLLGEDSESEDTRGVFGFDYLLPLNVEFTGWVDSDGGGRMMLEKEFELAPRLSLHGEVEYDSHEEWEGKVSLSYTITKDFSVTGGYHSEFGPGIGLEIRF